LNKNNDKKMQKKKNTNKEERGMKYEKFLPLWRA
jgi:hypothetical protein